jgi:TP901 family phage tail tape measure protein
MAVKVIETKAIISAQDRTGATFAAVAAKLRGMENAAASASRRMDGLARGMSDVGAAKARHEDIARRMSGGMNATAASAATTMASGVGAFAATATMIAAEKTIERAKEIARKTAEVYRDYDDKVRYMRAVLEIDESRQKPLIDQAIHLGGSTRFNDLQVLEGQLSLAQRGVRNVDTLREIVGNASDFGQAMNVDLPSAAKALESALFSTGQSVEEYGDAVRNAKRTTDLMVKTAKIGGLDAEGIQELFKFGGAAGHAAGLSIETMGALGAMMSRGGIPGSEAGVAIRSFSGSLLAPTSKAQMAFDAMGIHFKDYVKAGGGMTSANLNAALQRTLGKSLSPSQLAAAQSVLSNPDLASSSSDLTAALTPIIGRSFGRDKHGKLRAADAKAIAKTVGSFWTASIQSVDTERLLADVIAAKPSGAQSNAIFGEMQGGRFQVVAQRGIGEFRDYRGQLVHAPTGYAHQIGQERNAGYAGASARLEGSMANLYTALGRANDSWLTPITDAAAKTVQGLVDAGDNSIRMAQSLGAATAALVTFEGVLHGMSLLNGMAGNAGAAATFGGLAKALPGAFLSAGAWGAAAALGGYTAYKMIPKMPGANEQAPSGFLETAADRFDQMFGLRSNDSYSTAFGRTTGGWDALKVGGSRSGLLGFGLGGPVTQSPVAKLDGSARIDLNIRVEAERDSIVRDVTQNLIASGALRGGNSLGTSMLP